MFNVTVGSRRLLMVDPCDHCQQLLPNLSNIGWVVECCTLDTAGARVCDVGLLRLHSTHLDRPESIKDLIQRSGTEWIAVLNADLLLRKGAGELIGEWFFDFHTLPFDVERVQVMLGRAVGMARLRGSKRLVAEAHGNEIPDEGRPARELRKLLPINTNSSFVRKAEKVMPARANPIRVMLIDCRPLVLMGLHDLINAKKPQMEVSGQATTYAHALELANQLRPDVIFFSFFPDALDPLEVIAGLTRSAKMKVLVLKGLYETVPVARAIEAGARGVVLAEDPTESIIQAIVKVHHHDIGLDRAWAGGLSGYASTRQLPLKGTLEQAKQAQLTLRERELIRAIVGDPSAKYMRIAGRLGISEHTVHNHLSNIYHKLNLINRMDLLMYALKHGLTNNGEPPESTWVELD